MQFVSYSVIEKMGAPLAVEKKKGKEDNKDAMSLYFHVPGCSKAKRYQFKDNFCSEVSSIFVLPMTPLLLQ